MGEIQRVSHEIQEQLSKGESTRKLKIVNGLARRSGSTYWVLNAAIANPYCYIVFPTDQDAKQYERLYLRDTARPGQIHCEAPVFVGLDRFLALAESEQGLLSMPVIYDQSLLRNILHDKTKDILEA